MKAIKTKFLGPTNVRGSRVKACDCDGNQVTLSWDHALNSDENHRQAAVALCEKMQWTGADSLVTGWFKNEGFHVFNR